MDLASFLALGFPQFRNESRSFPKFSPLSMPCPVRGGVTKFQLFCYNWPEERRSPWVFSVWAIYRSAIRVLPHVRLVKKVVRLVAFGVVLTIVMTLSITSIAFANSVDCFGPGPAPDSNGYGPGPAPNSGDGVADGPGW